ncbi:MAG: outer membrane protein assembly factor BamE [Acinetobacter sp.]
MNVFLFKIMLCAATVTVLSGCHQNLSSPGRDGSVKDVVWPAPGKAMLGTGEGVFPTPGNIPLLMKGMTKEQVYLLLGRPHFSEGLFSVREWDYLLHFRGLERDLNTVTTCQLKIIYKSDGHVSNIYWRSVNLKNGVCPPDTVLKKNQYMLNTTVLFDFDQYHFSGLAPKYVHRIDEIISNIKEKHYDYIYIYGYADKQGSSEYNTRLSLLRAQAVANYFIANGLPKNKVFLKGMGESVPEAYCPDLHKDKFIECLYPDRKVVIVASSLK